jgi:hypothetical protein
VDCTLANNALTVECWSPPHAVQDQLRAEAGAGAQGGVRGGGEDHPFLSTLPPPQSVQGPKWLGPVGELVPARGRRHGARCIAARLCRYPRAVCFSDARRCAVWGLGWRRGRAGCTWCYGTHAPIPLTAPSCGGGSCGCPPCSVRACVVCTHAAFLAHNAAMRRLCRFTVMRWCPVGVPPSHVRVGRWVYRVVVPRPLGFPPLTPRARPSLTTITISRRRMRVPPTCTPCVRVRSRRAPSW